MSATAKPPRLPPIFPRALFIAAFAIAGARVSRVRPQTIAPLTPAREARRDVSIGAIVRRLGRAIVASERAHAAFLQRGSAYAPPAAKPRRVDVAALAVASSPEVAALIGKPGFEPSLDAPWIEVDRDAATPCAHLYWRGDLVPGERMARVFVGGRVVHGTGQVTDSGRDLDLERFKLAVEAAKWAMRKSGVRLSSFAEIRRLKTPALGNGKAFEGAVATIGLAKIQNPIRLDALVR